MEFELLELDDSALDSVIHFPKELTDFETVEKALCRGNKNGVTCTLMRMEYIEQN